MAGGLSSANLIDRMRRLRINVTSPDETVRVTLTIRDMTLALRPGCTERHTEKTLATQTAAALRSAFQGYQRATRMLRSELAGGRPVRALEDLPEGHPRRVLNAEGERLEVQVYSKNDYVSLAWHGRADFALELRPGTVRRLGETELAEELNSALRAAAAERRKQVGELNRRVSGEEG